MYRAEGAGGTLDPKLLLAMYVVFGVIVLPLWLRGIYRAVRDRPRASVALALQVIGCELICTLALLIAAEGLGWFAVTGELRQVVYGGGALMGTACAAAGAWLQPKRTVGPVGPGVRDEDGAA